MREQLAVARDTLIKALTVPEKPISRRTFTRVGFHGPTLKVKLPSVVWVSTDRTCQRTL